MNNVDSNLNKSFRLLDMYERFNKGGYISKKQLSDEYSVSQKTIQRDIDDLRAYFAEKHVGTDIKYDKRNQGYFLTKSPQDWLTNQEVFALAKITLDSRAFNKEELDGLLERLILQAAPESRELIKELVANERYHYVPLQHNSSLLGKLWKLSQAIKNKTVIKIHYQRQDGKQVVHEVSSLAVVFSEFYYYLIALSKGTDKNPPAVFRIDRITEMTDTKEKFRVPYRDRFEEGEFRKRIQFMYPGPLTTIKFKFWGPSLEAVLDRLPSIKKPVINNGKEAMIEAEVYGEKGIMMWLFSQAEYVEVLEPLSLREKMKESASEIVSNYEDN